LALEPVKTESINWIHCCIILNTALWTVLFQCTDFSVIYIKWTEKPFRSARQVLSGNSTYMLVCLCFKEGF
jgi:hypothetical protein